MCRAPSSIQLVWLLAILSNLFFYCSELPLIRLVEQKICRQYFGHLPSYPTIDQGCRGPIVQDQVATFIGLRTAFDAIPPLLVSLWYGSILNPKTIITLACTGELLNVGWVILVARGDYVEDVRLAWFAAFFLFIGGGQFLLYAMFSLFIVDITSPQDRARNLATLHSITLISSLVGAPLSGLLLKTSLDLAFSWVILLALARYLIIWGLQHPAGGTVNMAHERSAAAPDEVQVLLATNAASNTPPVVGVWSQMIALVRIPALAFTFLCFLLKRVAFTSEILMYQAVAERLDQILDDTAWVRIPIGLGAALTLWIILPIGLRQLKQVLRHGIVAEAWMVKLNLVVLAAGFALFWVSETFPALLIALTLCGIGEGLAPTLQTLASSITQSGRQRSLFAVISVVDTIAKLIGGPIMAWAFSIRDPKDRSYGYCFLLSSTLFTLMLCLSFAIPLPRHG